MLYSKVPRNPVPSCHLFSSRFTFEIWKQPSDQSHRQRAILLIYNCDTLLETAFLLAVFKSTSVFVFFSVRAPEDPSTTSSIFLLLHHCSAQADSRSRLILPASSLIWKNMRALCLKTLQALRSLWWNAVKLNSEQNQILFSNPSLTLKMKLWHHRTTQRSVCTFLRLQPGLCLFFLDDFFLSFRIWENTAGAHVLNSSYSFTTNSGWEEVTQD